MVWNKSDIVDMNEIINQKPIEKITYDNLGGFFRVTYSYKDGTLFSTMGPMDSIRPFISSLLSNNKKITIIIE